MGPRSIPSASDPPLPAARRLFTPGSVFWATFMSLPLAGGIVLAVNYSRFGERGKAVRAVLGSVVWSLVDAVLILLIPDQAKLGGAGIGGILAVVMWQIARDEQGPLVAAHRASGGGVYSKWLGVAIGLSTLAGLFILIVGVVLLIALLANPR